MKSWRRCRDDAVPTLSFAPGFPAADFRDCGPSVFAYGRTQADADAAADTLVALIESHEDDFDGRIYTPDEGVRHRHGTGEDRRSKPIVIADTQDNPGAGGDSDTTGMLRALVRNKAHARRDRRDLRSGVGKRRACGRRRRHRHALRSAASPASRATRRTRKPSSSKSCPTDKFVASGPYYGGRDMDMGPSACLRIGDVRVVVVARTRRSSRISRCTAMSASSRRADQSSSTRARCISAPISNRSPKHS